MKKRILAILLCLSLMGNILPLEVLAVKTQEQRQESPSHTFKDVKEGDWYYDSVMYAVDHKIFAGTSDDTFSVHAPMTRGMYVTILGRLANIGDSYAMKESLFKDVKPGAYYSQSISWAVDKGITRGIGNQNFGPDRPITREEMAIFTVRFFDIYNITYPEVKAKKAPADMEKITDYAKKEVLKFWNSGLLGGDEEGNFNPKKYASRAEVAAFSVRINKILLAAEEAKEKEKEEAEAKIDKESKEETKPSKKPNKEPDKKPPLNPGDEQEDTKSYSLTFNSNGGSNIKSKEFLSGSAMGELPIPYKDNKMFAGWYYDIALENRVLEKDVIKKDQVLYAKYSDIEPLAEAETPSFASALDQAPDFKLTVVSSKSMTSEEVKAGISYKNMSSQDEPRGIQVTGTGNVFTIAGQGGFEPGASYKFILEDEALQFQGFESSVRNYNFTIFKEEVLNLSLNQDLIYIPIKNIRNLTQEGEKVETVSRSTDLLDITEGSFEYDQPLQVGDSVTLYEGIRPDQRILNDTRPGADGNIAYIHITEVSGNRYSYKSEDIEEVLFKPDILPFENSLDKDGDPHNKSITANESDLVYSDDIYSPIQLDSQTTVDVGDYLAFYDGEFSANVEITEYGLITSVKDQDDQILVTYEKTSMDEILAAMDMYNTESMEGDKLLENVDIAALEADIEKQAKNSGFADEAAMYLADMALKTDSFTELSDDLEMTDFKMLAQSGEEISQDEIRLMAGDSKVEAELTHLKATISTNLKHFDEKGVRLTLDVGVEITITVNDDTLIVINVTGSFEEEVRVALNIDGGARWKWWGIFPYIDEYEATVNIDLFNYTGISINATIVTKEKEDNTWTENTELQNISEELKKLLDAKEEYMGDDGESVSDGLSGKYKEMLENESDWVNLFEKEMFSKSFYIQPLCILVVDISVNFLVAANMNISLGCDFYYENAKRYVYNIQVFSKHITTDVIDVREEHYEFVFYVMGTLGLRAGIKTEIAVGILSTKLGSVGFSAEFGVYTRVWGYFYYQLEYTASKGRNSSYSGALLFELGVYLEIMFEAQALGGLFSHEIELYVKEWPLWSAGKRLNVRDFSYTETDDLQMKKFIRQLIIPDDFFKMDYMDLKTGKLGQKVYDDGKDFKIELTNKAFSYDPRNNTISVVPKSGNQIESGELIITWGGAPLAFTSAPLERKFVLHWDDLNDGYTIMFNSNGGSVVPMILMPYNSPIESPVTPTKEGYTFDGWYTNELYTQEYVIPKFMPNADTIVYAKWLPRADTKYITEHYKQNANNNLYTIVEEDTKTFEGTTDSIVTPPVKAYPGFNTPEAKELTILPDGSAVMKYYYSRASYILTFDLGQAGESPIIYKEKYGKAISAPVLSRRGYTFDGWSREVPETMPLKDMEFIAKWKPADNVPYRLEHYIEKTSGKGYALTQIEEKAGSTNQELKLSAYAITKDGLVFEKSTVGGLAVEETQIKGDGSLVIKIYYTRNEYQLKYLVENGEDLEKTYSYGRIIEQPIVPVKEGYVFSGWKTSQDLVTPFEFGNPMPAKEVTIYGKLIPKDNIKFVTEHYYQKTSGDGYSLGKIEENKGTADESLILADIAISPSGFSFKEARVGEEITETALIKGDGSLVLKLYYSRNEYTISLEIKDQTSTKETYCFEEDIILPQVARKVGYTFTGWKTNEALTEAFKPGKMPANHMTLYGEFIANEGTAYTVEHYKQNPTGGGYTLVQVDQLVGRTDSQTTAIAKDYPGFTAQGVTQGLIAGDGKTVIGIDYDRNVYTVTLDPAGGSIASGEISDYTYGLDTLLPEDMIRQGYRFEGWFEGENKQIYISSQETGNKEYVAKWSANTDTKYKVKHLREDLDGRYTIEEIEIKYGTTDEQTEAANREYAGFTPEGISQKTIASDGETEIEISYRRNSYRFSWEYDEGDLGANYKELNVKYGSPIDQPEVEKGGYTFTGWHSDSALKEKYVIPNSMPAQNIDVYGKLIPNTGIAYKVIHYQQNAHDDGYSPYETEHFTGYTGEEVMASNKDYDYFYWNEYASESLLEGVIAGDGSLVLALYYERENFRVDYEVDGESYAEQETYRYGQKINYPSPPSKEGYFFDTWQLDGEAFTGNMPGKDIILTPGWSAGEKTYTFRYYLEQLNDQGGNDVWALKEEDNSTHRGTFDQPITAYPENDYRGFITPTEQEITLDASRSTVDFYYNRDRYLLKWDFSGGRPTNDFTQNGQVKFETPIIAPILKLEGNSYEWDREIEKIMPDSPLEYSAIWTPKDYLVQFSEDGLGNIKVTYGASYGDLPAPSKEGHTFDGWFEDENYKKKIVSDSQVTIAKDHVLYAGWKTNKYHIKWDLAGGSASNDYTQGTVEYESHLTAPIPSKTGYDFKGWNDTLYSKMPAENLSYQATWAAKTYRITLNPSGGLVGNDSIDVKYGEPYGSLEVPERTGFTFMGWFTQANNGQKITSDTLVTTTTDQILYGQWTAKPYNLTWDLAGGLSSSDYTQGIIDYGSHIIVPIISKAGYQFTGWQPGLSHETMPAKDLAYTATWLPEVYDVTLEVSGGQINGEAISDYTYGVGADLPLDLTRPGYTFSGWYEGESKVSKILPTDIGHKTYRAKWSVDSYGIIYHNMEGAQNHENNLASYTFGNQLILGGPTKLGYNFEGWYTDEALTTKVSSILESDTGDKAFYAKWLEKVYRVTLDTGHGILASQDNVTSYTYGQGASLPTSQQIKREGYIFGGWSNGSEIVREISVESTGDQSFAATWSIVTYGISYELNGGLNSSDNPLSYNIGTEDVYLAEPTRESHLFAGWFKEAGLITPVDSPAILRGSLGDITFYAKWNPITYSVAFQANGGTGSMGTQTFELGESKQLSSNGFTREGYNFIGWATSYNGNKVYDQEAMVSDLAQTNEAVVNLYALWTPIKYTIAYNLNGGINSKNEVEYTVETRGIALNNPTRDRYSFQGWYDNPDFTGSKITHIAAGSIGNLDLYANWKAKADISGIGQAAQTLTFNGSAQNFAITGTDLKDLLVKYKKSGDSQWQSEAIHAGTYAVQITRPSDENYNDYKLEIDNALEIKRASRTISGPTGGSASYSKITVNPVTGFSGYGHGDVEYAVSRTASTPTSGWTNSLSIGDLYTKGNYYLFARVTEGGDFLAATSGPSSAVVNLTKPYEKIDRAWRIGIKTGTNNGAGTGANIGLRFKYKDIGYGSRKTLGTKDHENGSYHSHSITEDHDPWLVEGFEIGQDGKGGGSKWQCAYVDLRMGNMVDSKQVLVNTWFDDKEYTYYPADFFKRTFTSLREFDGWAGAHTINDSSTGTIAYGFNGYMTDQYGTYNAYARTDAPVISISPSLAGYTDCFSYNAISFTIDRAKLNKKMADNKANKLTFTINMTFNPRYTNNYQHTRTVTINR